MSGLEGGMLVVIAAFLALIYLGSGYVVFRIVEIIHDDQEPRT